MLKQRHKFTQSLDTNVEFQFKEFFHSKHSCRLSFTHFKKKKQND